MKRSRTLGVGIAAAFALLASASTAVAQPCSPEGASSACVGGLGIRYCFNGAWTDCRIETCESFRGITLSDGPTVTAEDLAQFDARWTNDHAGESCVTRQHLAERCDECVWKNYDRMHALIRMYDLTHDGKYAAQLRDLVEHAFQFRDDHHPGRVETIPACVCEHCVAVDLPPRPLDLARQKNMPGWGGKSPNYGGFHAVSDGSSALYAHAMAAFARIVLEDSALTQYSDDAVRHTNAVIETVYAFLPDIAYRERGGQVEAYLLSGKPTYRTPTEQECTDAYDEEIKRIRRDLKDDPAEWPAADKRAESMRNNCNDTPKIGPRQHNINLSFAMMLIELSRALESPSYRQSPQRSNDAEPARLLAPVLVSRLHRYFVTNLHTVTDSPRGSRFVWNFSDDVPAGVATQPENNHAALDMRYVELIARDHERLSRLAAAAAPGESISFDETHMRRFANTFLQKLVRGPHLAHDVTGKPADPIDAWDGLCDGWVVPSAADPQVYEVCRAMTLRVVFRNPRCEQAYLNMSNHAALLAHKRFASAPPPPPPPPVEVPDVIGLSANLAGKMLRDAGLLPKFTGTGTTVKTQSPRAGTVVARGTQVSCTTQREVVQ